MSTPARLVLVVALLLAVPARAQDGGAGPRSPTALGRVTARVSYVTPRDQLRATRKAVAGVQGVLDACYRERLEKVPALAGTGAAFVAWNAKGKVTEVSVTGLGDAKLAACFSKALKTLVPPAKSDGGAALVLELSGPAEP
jgi:hypothetical protein